MKLTIIIDDGDTEVCIKRGNIEYLRDVLWPFQDALHHMGFTQVVSVGAEYASGKVVFSDELI